MSARRSAPKLIVHTRSSEERLSRHSLWSLTAPTFRFTRYVVLRSFPLTFAYPANQQPILLLALEDYYRSPSLSILQRLYSAINSMDLTGLPVLSRDERLVLRGSERKDLFEEKFWGGNSISSPLPEHRQLGRTPSTASFATSSNAAEVLDTTASSFDRQSLRSSDSRSSLRDPSASSSTDDLAWKARSRAGTVGSAASDFAAPSGAVSPTEGRSTMAASMIGSTMGSSVGGVTGGRPKDTHFFETKVHYAGIPLPIRIPVGTMEEEIGDVSDLQEIYFAALTLCLSTVLAHQPHSNLLSCSFLLGSRFLPRLRPFPSPSSHVWPFHSSRHPSHERPPHAQARRLSRPPTSCRQGRRAGAGCLRAR